MVLEVHSSLSSFGELEGGARTVIDTLKELVTEQGSIFMPALGWGLYGKKAVSSGLDYPIHNGGKALMLGVDIYKLTAMHYGEWAIQIDKRLIMDSVRVVKMN